jgi:uncharacterized membrane protein HdeD (DUF308 family)
MPTDETTLTLSLILTAAGAVAASALVTGVVQILKQLGNFLNGKERLAAFILSAVLVVIAYAAGLSDGTLTLNIASGFAAFIAFYGIARLSMAVYADIVKEPNSLTGPKS